VRSAAAATLAEIGDAAAIQPLIRALADGAREVRKKTYYRAEIANFAGVGEFHPGLKNFMLSLRA